MKLFWNHIKKLTVIQQSVTSSNGTWKTVWCCRKDLNPPERIYVVLSRGKWETRDQNMQMSWRPRSKKPGLPHHLSSATNWSPPYHAELRQQLKQKELLPSIEYIYSKRRYFPEGQQFTKNVFFIGLKYYNLLRVNWWVFVKCEPKSSQLKEPTT